MSTGFDVKTKIEGKSDRAADTSEQQFPSLIILSNLFSMSYFLSD